MKTLKKDIKASGFAALLFDMDGIIIDSMPLHLEAWRDTLAHYALIADKYEIYRREGEKGEVTATDMLNEAGLVPTKDNIAVMLSYKRKLFKDFGAPPLFDGIEDLLKTCRKQGLKIAMVTGTSMNEVTAVLPKHIRDLFELQVTGDMLKQGKPDPLPYITACTRLGTAPADTLVIENAPYGITSAKKAGCTCIAVETSLPARYLEEADLIVHTIKDLHTQLFPPSNA